MKVAHQDLTENELDFCNRYVRAEYKDFEELGKLYGVTGRQLYNWLRMDRIKDEIRKQQELMVDEARTMLKRGVRIAAANLINQAKKGDVRASEDVLEYAQVIEKQAPLNIVNQNVQTGGTVDKEPTADEFATLQRIIQDYASHGNNKRLQPSGVDGQNLFPGVIPGTADQENS